MVPYGGDAQRFGLLGDMLQGASVLHDRICADLVGLLFRGDKLQRQAVLLHSGDDHRLGRVFESPQGHTVLSDPLYVGRVVVHLLHVFFETRNTVSVAVDASAHNKTMPDPVVISVEGVNLKRVTAIIDEVLVPELVNRCSYRVRVLREPVPPTTEPIALHSVRFGERILKLRDMWAQKDQFDVLIMERSTEGDMLEAMTADAKKTLGMNLDSFADWCIAWEKLIPFRAPTVFVYLKDPADTSMDSYFDRDSVNIVPCIVLNSEDGTDDLLARVMVAAVQH